MLFFLIQFLLSSFSLPYVHLLLTISTTITTHKARIFSVITISRENSKFFSYRTQACSFFLFSALHAFAYSKTLLNKYTAHDSYPALTLNLLPFAMAGLGFSSLPPEVRNMIYKLVFVQENPINVYWGALAQAGRAFKNEASSISNLADWFDENLASTTSFESMKCRISRNFISSLKVSEVNGIHKARGNMKDEGTERLLAEAPERKVKREDHEPANEKMQLQFLRTSKLVYEEGRTMFYALNSFQFYIGQDWSLEDPADTRMLLHDLAPRHRFWLPSSPLKFPIFDVPIKYLPIMRRCNVQVFVSTFSILRVSPLVE